MNNSTPPPETDWMDHVTELFDLGVWAIVLLLFVCIAVVFLPVWAPIVLIGMAVKPFMKSRRK